MSRIIIESSSLDGVLTIIEDMKNTFPQVDFTNPVKTPEGGYIASVHYSMEAIRIDESNP